MERSSELSQSESSIDSRREVRAALLEKAERFGIPIPSVFSSWKMNWLNRANYIMELSQYIDSQIISPTHTHFINTDHGDVYEVCNGMISKTVVNGYPEIESQYNWDENEALPFPTTRSAWKRYFDHSDFRTVDPVISKPETIHPEEFVVM